MRFLAAIFAAVLLFVAAPAGASVWTAVPIPYPSADVTHVVMAPSQPSRLYAACERAGVYRSDDRGDSWTLAARGVPYDSYVSLMVHPMNPDIVLASSGGNLYLTVNAGESWAVWDESATSITAHAICPSSSNVVLGSWNAAGGPVARSTDFGRTWSSSSQGFTASGVYEFSFNPASPNEVVAAGTDGIDGVYRSADFGQTWALVSPSFWCRSVSWSAADQARVYAYLYDPNSGNEIHRSTDFGLSFQPTGGDGAMLDLFFIRAHPTIPSFLYSCGGSFQQMFDPRVHALVGRSTDSGATWDICFEAPNPTSDNYAQSLVLDASDGGRIYVSGGDDAGIWRTQSDGTGPWDLKIQGMSSATIDELEIGGAGKILVRDRSMDPMVFVSGTGQTELFPPPFVNGLQWESVDDAEIISSASVTRLFESGAFGLDEVQTYFCRIEAGDPAWDPPDYPYLPGGFETWDSVHHIVASPSGTERVESPVYVWASTTDFGNRVFRSVDGGASYEPRGVFTNVVDAAIDSSNPDRLYAMSSSSDRVRASTDGGLTWQPRTTGLPVGTPLGIRVDAANGDHVLAAFASDGVFVSENGGTSWSPIPLDAPSALVGVDWDSEHDRVIAATADHGVVVSDVGVVNEGLETRDLRAVVYSSLDETVYLATWRMGVWSMPLPSVPVYAELVAVGLPAGVRMTSAPNPFRDATSIRFAPSGVREDVCAEVFDLAGRRVRILFDGPMDGTQRELTWNGRNAEGKVVAAGAYTVRLTSASRRESCLITRVR